VSEEPTEAHALPEATSIGQVAIRVDDLDRVLPFYRDVIGCRVDRDGSLAHLSAADGRELVVLQADPDAPARPRSAAGLFHVAIRLPDRASLADALARIRDSDVGASLTGASDHLVSEALYLRDPAGNGVELYRDRPRPAWDRLEGGRVEMDTLPLDLGDLAASGDGAASEALPAGTDVGHVHLEVTDLDASTEFYVAGLGLRRSTRAFGGASFLAAGDYHHHVGLNVWNRRTTPLGDHQGLRWFEVVLPDEGSRERTIDRLVAAGFDVTEDDGVPVVSDPDRIPVRLVGTDA
jgi:catechol 2,3-dioxygenase